MWARVQHAPPAKDAARREGVANPWSSGTTSGCLLLLLLVVVDVVLPPPPLRCLLLWRQNCGRNRWAGRHHYWRGRDWRVGWV